MKWLELAIRTSEEAAEAVVHWLGERGAAGVAEESASLYRKRNATAGEWAERELPADLWEGESVIRAYFPEHAEGQTAEALVADVRDFLQRLPTETGLDAGAASVSARIVDEEDWAEAWKRYFRPVRVSERLTVKPTWETYSSEPGEIVIELDPGMAFGTGTHATTQLCLRAMERRVVPGDHVIDVGTGSGVLAVAAAKLGAARVLALDCDPVATASAAANVRLNGLDGRVFVLESDLLSIIEGGEDADRLPVKPPVQGIVANLLAELVVRLAPQAYRALAGGGYFIASGVIAAKADETAAALERVGFRLVQSEELDGWVALVTEKPVAEKRGTSAPATQAGRQNAAPS